MSRLAGLFPVAAQPQSADWKQALCSSARQGQSTLYEVQANSSSSYLLTLLSGPGGDADLFCSPAASLYAYGPPSPGQYAWSSGAPALPRPPLRPVKEDRADDA